MEYEIRYYYNTKELDNIINKLKEIKELTQERKRYEKTVQYDHPSKENSFYSKEIDGRFRIRKTKNNEISKCMISWKRRVEKINKDDINHEEEVELEIKYQEYDNLIFLIENVLKMKKIESYERYRTIFKNKDIEIAVDEYPFGIALEIENKSKTKDPKETVKKWAEKLNLDINKSYKLSWDDKYRELCKSQKIKQYNHVTFDLPMPEVTK